MPSRTDPPRTIFVTGATGYLGSRLSAALGARGHEVRALARKGSENKLPPGCTPVVADALLAATFAGHARGADTLVHLVGVARPSPAKAREFRSVDLLSVQSAIEASKLAGVRHVVYVSVAHPAPVMKAYVEVRKEAEALLRASGLTLTIVRPWYVLGPGHWWPLVLVPIYWIAAIVPGLRDGARRLGLVTVDQMVKTLVGAVEAPPSRERVIDVPGIRLTSRSDRLIETH